MKRVQQGATVGRYRALREALVEAAEAAVRTGGLEAVRARGLAEAAGCSVGAIYGVFPDLDALVLVVNGRTLEAIDAALRGVAAEESLAGLADVYLTYAAQHRRRWEALFQHRMAAGAAVPGWYAERQVAAFSHVEGPLGVLRPELTVEERGLLARTLFSAVHGMVALGLDEKVAAMPLAVLREQIRTVVRAMAAGLASGG